MNSKLRIVVIILIAIFIIIWKYCEVPTNKNELANDPIPSFGHGSFFDSSGNAFKPNSESIIKAQKHYISVLKNSDEGKKKKSEIKEKEKLIFEIVDDDVLANAVFIDWLLERIQIAKIGHLAIVNNALRWYYVLNLKDNPILPDENNSWSKGLDKDTADKLENIGVTTFLITNAAGPKYREECLNAGVPVPPNMFGEEWINRGVFTNEFISSGLEAELWLYESENPKGVCLALPRYNSKNEAELLGIICLGTQSNNACFFDNPTGTFFKRNETVGIEKFVGGADLVTNAQGECSNCHAGENPFVVHPEKSAFQGLTDKLRPQGWHYPLVVASWAQNPGPTNLLDVVDSPQQCNSCHTRSYAGRFPEVSTLLQDGNEGYCTTVLQSSVGLKGSSIKTMPMGGGSTAPFQAHIDALLQACSEGPPNESGIEVDAGDVADDISYISSPNIFFPVYKCATGLTIRSVILNAKVNLYLNGSLISSVSPSRSNEEVKFEDLPSFNVGDELTATQEVDGVISDFSPKVIVRDHNVDYPNGLPAPEIDPTLIYECAELIAVRHVPGSKLTIYSNGADPVTYSTSIGWTEIRPRKRPFDVGDKFTAEISLCGDKSPISNEEITQTAPSSLQSPSLNPNTIYEGQELIHIENITNGATVSVGLNSLGEVGTFSSSVSWEPEYDIATKIGRPLNLSDIIILSQKLCDKTWGKFVTNGQDCASIPAPRIRHPRSGDTYVLVTSSIPGARIHVYDNNNNELGDGSGTIIHLNRAITGAGEILVVQQLGKCFSKKGYKISVRNSGDGQKPGGVIESQKKINFYQ